MMKGLALFLFDLTGNMAQPWEDAGYPTLSIDIQRDGTDILAYRKYKRPFSAIPEVSRAARADEAVRYS
jgi:hypothetical protein